MTGWVQAGLALVLAVGLHLGAFAFGPGPAGAVASGAGGSDLVSVQAADAALTDLVADWDRPPELPPALPAKTPMPSPVSDADDAFDVVVPAAEPRPDPARQAALQTVPPLLPQMADLAPRADAPPPPIAPVTEAVPESLPVPLADARPDLSSKRPRPRPTVLAQPTPKPAEARPKPATAEKKASKSGAKPPVAKPAAAPPVSGQKAAGSGGGAEAGQGGRAAAATLSKARLNDLKAGWGATVRSRIERRKTYPAAAGGVSGTVTLRLTISRSGKLAGVSVARSSGHAALDKAALRAVTAAGRFPAAPDGLTEPSYSFTLPMTFAR